MIKIYEKPKSMAETEYKDIQEKLMRAILDDSKLWSVTGIQDRDFLGAYYDSNEHYGDKEFKKQMSLVFEIKYVSCSQDKL